MCICVVRHALQGYRQDINGPKHTPQFLSFLTCALELSSFPVCSIYQDGSHQGGLGALRASHSW